MTIRRMTDVADAIAAELQSVIEQMKVLQADASARARFLAEIAISGEVPAWTD